MEREDLIDLGAASAVTQGPGGEPIDEALGLNRAGIAND